MSVEVQRVTSLAGSRCSVLFESFRILCLKIDNDEDMYRVISPVLRIHLTITILVKLVSMKIQACARSLTTATMEEHAFYTDPHVCVYARSNSPVADVKHSWVKSPTTFI